MNSRHFGLLLFLVFFAIGSDALTRHKHLAASSNAQHQSKHFQNHHLHKLRHNSALSEHSLEQPISSGKLKDLIEWVSVRYLDRLTNKQISDHAPNPLSPIDEAVEFYAEHLFDGADAEEIRGIPGSSSSSITSAHVAALIAVPVLEYGEEEISTNVIARLVKAVTTKQFLTALDQVITCKKAKDEYIDTLEVLGFTEISPAISRRISEAIFEALHLSSTARWMTKSVKYIFSGTEVSGEFDTIRGVLDHKYHGHYHPQRILIQDAVINQYLRKGPRAVTHPWILFTGGPMGAGKGYVLDFLERTGKFTKSDFLEVDFDNIREHLPEYDFMNKINPHAMGFFTQPEVAMIGELLQNIGMSQSKNVLIDGSLQNSDWYGSEFARLKSNFPAYRFALLFVFADLEQVLAQAHSRQLKTGRGVPVQVLQDAYAACVRSSEVLERHPAIDISFTFYNKGETPRLSRKIQKTPGSNYGILQTLASMTASAGSGSSLTVPGEQY